MSDTAGAAPPVPEPRSNNTVNTVNSLIHLYRAEMGRMTAYRARLDTTTNWAITTSALVTTFVLSSENQSHAASIFLMFLNYFFLHLEARRFSAYEASRRRIRLLEHHFYPEILGDQPDPAWVDRLIAALRYPRYPTVPLLVAISWRLRRVYLWIYAAVLLSWLSKLDLHGFSAHDLVTRAAIGSVPGWLVSFGVLALYAWLIGVALWPGRRHPLSDPYAV
jgi:uncharacterized membrane protein